MKTRYDEYPHKASRILFTGIFFLNRSLRAFRPPKWLQFKMFNGFLTLRINLLTTNAFIMCIFAPKFKITR